MAVGQAERATSTANPLAGPPPRWDMTAIYPALESSEFAAAFESVLLELGALRELCDAHGVRRRDAAPLDDTTVEAFEAVTDRLNALSEELRTVYAYITAFVTTNARDDLAQARLSELQGQLVELRKLGVRYDAWIGSLDVEALIKRSALASGHAFALRKAALSARHQMSEPEEDLAATLNLSGGTAWAKLHGNVSSRLT